ASWASPPVWGRAPAFCAGWDYWSFSRKNPGGPSVTPGRNEGKGVWITLGERLGRKVYRASIAWTENFPYRHVIDLRGGSMRKLPVLATTCRVYSFLWNGLGTIVRLAWLPLLLVAAAGYVSSVLLGQYFAIPEETPTLKPVVNGLPGFALKNTVAAIID